MPTQKSVDDEFQLERSYSPCSRENRREVDPHGGQDRNLLMPGGSFIERNAKEDVPHIGHQHQNEHRDAQPLDGIGGKTQVSLEPGIKT